MDDWAWGLVALFGIAFTVALIELAHSERELERLRLRLVMDEAHKIMKEEFNA